MESRENIGEGSVLVSNGHLKYIRFKCFEKYSNELVHCMSTRIGGVSTGECESLNFGFNRNDARENVIENYRRICNAIDMDCNSMVFSNQVHDSRIWVAGEKDRGKGFCTVSDIIGYDGLMTNVPGVALVTFYADCVPLFLYDSIKKAAALVHSGWKGTIKNIAAVAVEKLKSEFGCSPENIIAAIGPSIGKCCFETGNDVYELFYSKYGNGPYYQEEANSKWKIDLQGIIMSELIKSGLLRANVHNSGICTKCMKSLFFSHRGDCGKTGSLAAFMQLK